jgi:RNA polymerase sigma-70 factor (ECF subfamily)
MGYIVVPMNVRDCSDPDGREPREMTPFDILLERARQKDPRAIEALHARFAGLVLARIRSRLSPALRRRYDSTDIAQSVVVELIGRLHTFEDRGEEAFRHWLYTVAEHKIRSKLRRLRDATGRRREVALSGEVVETTRSPNAGPITSAEAAEERAQVRAEIGRVDDETRELIRLRIDEEQSFAQIAERLSLPSADAARMRFTRAVSRLRDRWRDSASD